MIIYPAIDISNGQCVRLIKGDFKKKNSIQYFPTASSEDI